MNNIAPSLTKKTELKSLRYIKRPRILILTSNAQVIGAFNLEVVLVFLEVGNASVI